MLIYSCNGDLAEEFSFQKYFLCYWVSNVACLSAVSFDLVWCPQLTPEGAVLWAAPNISVTPPRNHPINLNLNLLTSSEMWESDLTLPKTTSWQYNSMLYLWHSEEGLNLQLPSCFQFCPELRTTASNSIKTPHGPSLFHASTQIFIALPVQPTHA